MNAPSPTPSLRDFRAGCLISFGVTVASNPPTSSQNGDCETVLGAPRNYWQLVVKQEMTGIVRLELSANGHDQCTGHVSITQSDATGCGSDDRVG